MDTPRREQTECRGCGATITVVEGTPKTCGYCGTTDNLYGQNIDHPKRDT